MILIVTYDLKHPAASYTQLFEILKSYDSWAHYMFPTWFIATNNSPQEIYRELSECILEGDRILIVELTPGYYGWLPKKAWDWIHRYEQKQGTTSSR